MHHFYVLLLVLTLSEILLQFVGNFRPPHLTDLCRVKKCLYVSDDAYLVSMIMVSGHVAIASILNLS